MVKAVVFDLWQTLAAWPEQNSVELRQEWSRSLGVSPRALDELVELSEPRPPSPAAAG